MDLLHFWVKLMQLAKFLYLLQSLFILLPQSYFSFLNSLMRCFLWHGKTPMVSLDKLVLDYDHRKFNLPNFRMHYLEGQTIFFAQMFDNAPFPCCSCCMIVGDWKVTGKGPS